MFKSALKTAWRSMIKNKSFAAINVLGLVIGISACLVIYLIVSYDLSFDRFEKDNNRIYRVVSEMKFSGQPYYNPGVPEPLAGAIKTEVTGVAEIIPFLQPNTDIKVAIPAGGNKITVFKKQNDIIFAGDSYFNLLSYQWVARTSLAATAEPMQVVLTESRARLYFPTLNNREMLGKIITYNDSIPVTVAGIVKDLGQQTDFSFKEFISLPTARSKSFKNSYAAGQWTATNGTSQLFLKLTAQNNTAQVENQLFGLINKYRKDQKQDADNSYHLRLQPLSDLHFNSKYSTFVQWDSGDRTGTVSRPVLYGLLIAGVLLLLLACANFINLATAQSTTRAKEVGVRKTMGSSKALLCMQFMVETLMVTLIAAIISVALIPLLLKTFSGFIPQGLHFSLARQPGIIACLTALIIVVTLLAGFYPSVVLSNYNPVDVLKSRPSTDGNSRKTRIRKTLTIAQFAIAQAFIMGALVIGSQIKYMLNKDMGFKKDAVVYFYASGSADDKSKRAVLLNNLKAMPGIAMVSLSNEPPSSTNQWSGKWNYNNGKTSIATQVQMKVVDTAYINLYKIKLLAGQNIRPSDTVNSVVINETYAHLLGFKNPHDAIGKLLYRKGKPLPVRGVVADFHESSLHEEIKPLSLISNIDDEYCINVLLRQGDNGSSNWQATINKIAAQYKTLYPQSEFEYHFLDDSIARLYKGEQDVAVLLNWATSLAIIISCMGLLGLVMYTTNSRAKEISIRKILGASVTGVIVLLSKDFLQLVGIAFLIAIPVAWWGSQQWLAGFAYRISVSWWVFAATSISMLAIAFLTLSVQVIKTALVNPVKSLKNE